MVCGRSVTSMRDLDALASARVAFRKGRSDVLTGAYYIVVNDRRRRTGVRC